MSKRVVVTGAAGVIGRELVSRLLVESAEILTLDRRPMADGLADRVRHVQIDLATGGMDEIHDFAPSEIYHLAAAFERSVEEPGFWDPNFNDNVLVSHRLHALLRRLGSVKTYVFASSYLIYRPDLYLFASAPDTPRQLCETDPVDPRNLCGAAKYLAEREIDFMTEVDRLPMRAVSARIYRVYGRGSRCVISRWTRALLRNETLTVFNPGNRFDYVFAGDVAEGLQRLASAPSARGIVNLATGRCRSVAEVVKVLERNVSNTAALIDQGEDAAPYEASEANVSRLSELTGWQPGIAIEEGIRLVVDYERKHLAGAAEV
jgi:carbamoyl-phosphate synthase large subunit